MRGTILIVCMWLALSGCKSKPMPPAGGGNNTGGGGPTTPDPIATTGTISGAVTSRNVGVSGALVSLGIASTVTTGTAGAYSFPDVAPGTHTVTLTPPRLFSLVPGETAMKSTTVTAGQTSTVNWTLTQGAVGPTPVIFVVFLDPSAFRPRDVTISRGDTVLWSNAQPVFHTISPDDRNQAGAWRTENIPARTGASFSHVFNTDGIFHYSCTVHIGMTGVVRVR